MKNTLFSLFLIYITSTVAFAKDYTPKGSAQQAVISKFEHDIRAFEEYSTLGKVQCYTKLFDLEEKFDGRSELFMNTSIRMYNERSPLLRLISEQSIKNNLLAYMNTKQITDEKSPNKSYYYTSTVNCESMFNVKNEDLRKAYLRLTKNPENYVKPGDKYDAKEIQGMKNDYIEYYFIRVDVDGCPLRAPTC